MIMMTGDRRKRLLARARRIQMAAATNVAVGGRNGRMFDDDVQRGGGKDPPAQLLMPYETGRHHRCPQPCWCFLSFFRSVVWI
jgi:hypothetical protein